MQRSDGREDDARQAAQSRWHTPIFDKPLEKRRLRILQGLFKRQELSKSRASRMKVGGELRRKDCEVDRLEAHLHAPGCLWVANWQLWHKSPLWCSLA
jgi:hypothetical protein